MYASPHAKKKLPRHSKTIWINALTVLIAAALLISGSGLVREYPKVIESLVLASGLLNIFLRLVTDQPIILQRKSIGPRLMMAFGVLLCPFLPGHVTATTRTANFVVTAPTADFECQVAQVAEESRTRLAEQFLGRTLPQWAEPCVVQVRIAPCIVGGQTINGNGGQTTMAFYGGEVGQWDMLVYGSPKDILGSVLPHEVGHTILASHFRQPLPRWADEGICSAVEEDCETCKLRAHLLQSLRCGRGIPFAQMLSAKEYPPDVGSFYAQANSAATFLIHSAGYPTLVDCTADAMQSGWAPATQKHYGFASLGEFQNTWLDWVKAGSPAPQVEAHAANYQQCQWIPGRGWQCPQQQFAQPARVQQVPAPLASRPAATTQPVPAAPLVPICKCQGKQCECDTKSLEARLVSIEKSIAGLVTAAPAKECACDPAAQQAAIEAAINKAVAANKPIDSPRPAEAPAKPQPNPCDGLVKQVALLQERLTELDRRAPAYFDIQPRKR